MKNPTKKNKKTYLLKISEVLFIPMLLLSVMNASAQPSLAFHTDAGKNIISDEMFLKTSLISGYVFGKNQLQAGIRTNIVNCNNTVLSGGFLNGSRFFKIGSVPLAVNAFWIWTAPSDILKEINYGCSISLKQKHLDIMLGTNFRTYALRKKAYTICPINDDNTKIHENFNIMYSFGYNIKQPSSKWNAGLTVTNTDYFLINQETNPYMNVHSSFRISTPVTLFAEAWYKTSGALNMTANYFGYTLRLGMIWKIR